MTIAPRHIVIVGRDAPLWLTSTVLKQALGSIGIAVTAIELPSKLSPGSVYATMPAIETLHSRLGLDEAAVLRVTSGSFALGWNIVRNGAPSFMLAHGTYGAPIDGQDFFPYWAKARQLGLKASFEDFSPTAMAARHGRILVPDDATETFGRTDYAYHLPAILYAALLKSRAQQLGVTIHQTVGVKVERDGESGAINSVRPDSSAPVAGDLFIDASGSDAVLITGALAIGSDDWRDYFPVKRVLTASGRAFASVPAYAELRLAADGWTALHASQAQSHIVHASNDDQQDDEALIKQASARSGTRLDNMLIRPNAPAARAQSWAANCIAIGGSACVLDPLFDLDLHQVQLGIVHLLSLFPNSLSGEAERREYNRLMRSHFERLRDFQAAVGWLTKASASAPSSLVHKVETFNARGTIAPMEDETFSPDQWRALFVGLGQSSLSWPPAIDTTDPERIKDGFRRILGFVHDKVVEQPTHDRYLAIIGASTR